MPLITGFCARANSSAVAGRAARSATISRATRKKVSARSGRISAVTKKMPQSGKLSAPR